MMDKINELRVKAAELASKMEPTLVDARKRFKTAGAKVIRDLKRGERFARSYMLKARERQFWVRALYISAEKNEATGDVRIVVQAGIKPRNHSRALWYADIHADTVRVSTHKLVEAVERFSNLYLVVSYPEDAEYSYLLDRTIVVYDNEYYWQGEDGTWINMVEGTPVEEEVLYPEGKLVEGALVYNAFGEEAGYDSSSAGETKRLAIPFVCQNMPNVPARLYKYIMSDGASEYLIREGEFSGKEMAQANNRLSQHDAPQTAFGKLGVVCWHLGKFRNEKGEDHTDGLGYLNAEWFAGLLSALSDNRYHFKASAVKGIAVQMRPATCKLLAWCVSSKVIKALMDRYSDQEPIVLMRDEITEEEQGAFVSVVRDKAKVDGWSGRNLIICDTQIEKDEILAGDYSRIQFYTDLNGLKAPYDLKRELDHGVLDITHASHDVENGANTSTQFLSSLMTENMGKTWKGLVGAFAKLLSKKESVFLKEDGSIPSVKMFDKGQSLNQTLVRMCPVLARKFYFPLLKSVVDKMVEGLVNKVGNLNIPCAGIYSKILPDPAVNFGVHILKVEDGGFLNVIHQGASKAGYTRGVGIKYPKQHYREFAKSVIHDVSWYIEQVKASDELSAEQKDVLIDMVSQLSEGAVIIPAYDAVMHMLAGLDYDGDAMIMYLDEWMVDILWDVEPLSVYIEDETYQMA